MNPKNIYLIAVIFILLNKLGYSQDIMTPHSLTFTTGSSTYTLSKSDPSNQYNSFVLGWQWSGGRQISELLKMNSGERGSDPNSIKNPPERFNDGFKIIRFIPDVSSDNTGINILNSMNMQYLPVLRINDLNDNYKKNDENNSIWGFEQVKGRNIDNQLFLNHNNFSNKIQKFFVFYQEIKIITFNLQ